MKYMLLMACTATYWEGLATLTEDDLRAQKAFLRDLEEHLGSRGELISDEGLAGPTQARVVHASGDGAPVIARGPFSPTREFLVGFWVVDCDTPERAVEIAARISTAPGRGGVPLNLPVEVRPVMRAPGEEM